MPRRPGPRPLPANVHRLRGNRSDLTEAELEEREELQVRPLAPKPPKGLSPAERECWELHAHELEHLGLLTHLDTTSYRLLCTAYALAMACLDAMRPTKADGTPDRRRTGFQVVVPDERGSVKKHPAFTEWQQATATYLRLCIEFGMTPSARVGLRPAAWSGGTVPDDDSDEDDSAFFGT